MTQQTLGYHVVYKPDKSQGPTNVVAAWIRANEPFRAVIWSHPDGEWKYAPGIAARTIYDDRLFDRVFPVNRAEAEQIAREHLGTELPSEEEIRRICEEGAKQGRNSGLPT